MQTLDRLSSTAPLSWFRAGMNRLWRAMMARRLAVRVGLVLALVLGVAAAGYWAASTLVPSGTRDLASGRSFSSEDVIKITQALDAKGISYRVDDRKIVIAAEQYDQAVAVFAKLHVGPMTFDEIRSPPDWFSSLVETPQDKERNERRLQREIDRALHRRSRWGRLVGGVDPSIRRPGAHRHLRAKPSAFVYLETEPNRPLPSRTVQTHPHDPDQQRARAEPRVDHGDRQRRAPLPRPEQSRPWAIRRATRRARTRNCARRSWRS